MYCCANGWRADLNSEGNDEIEKADSNGGFASLD
jgi:hypothetical protein